VDEPQRGERRRDGEQEVDVQAPAPVEGLGEDAAEEQADRRARAGDAAEDGERLRALLGLHEARGQQRQRARGEHGGEHALGGARGGEQPERGRGAAGGGRHREADQAADEGPLAAEQITELAAQQQQGAERQRVRGDDPLPRVVGEAEVGLGAGERDVHDRRVEHDHQLRDGDDPEDQPAALVVGVVRVVWHWRILDRKRR
jgi:hypothetical protein